MQSFNQTYALGSYLFAGCFLVLLVLSMLYLKQNKLLYATMLFITLTAMTSYTLMSRGIGIFYRDGILINATRYIEWSITTPLLLYILTNLILLKGRPRSLIVLKLVSLDLIMIITGFIAGLTNGLGIYFWFGISSAAYLCILNIITTQLLSSEQMLHDSQAKKIVLRIAWIILVFWSLYPLVWILGRNGIASTGEETKNVMYMVLDLSSKIGFAVLLFHHLYVIEKTLPSRSKNDA